MSSFFYYSEPTQTLLVKSEPQVRRPEKHLGNGVPFLAQINRPQFLLSPAARCFETSRTPGIGLFISSVKPLRE